MFRTPSAKRRNCALHPFGSNHACPVTADALLFPDEDVDWAAPLRNAGVETILNVVPGSYPSAKYVRPHAPVMVAFRTRMLQALQQGLAESDDKGRGTP